MPDDADFTLCRLMTWLSPSFPVGAYAYSHGLEHAVEAGLVADAVQLDRWVSGLLAFGAGRFDAALFRGGWEAARDDDRAALAAVVERGAVTRGAAELALESAAQGQAFLDTVLQVWPRPWLYDWKAALAESGRTPVYPVAVGVACAVAAVPLRPALTAYLHAFAANLVSAGVRLVPLGQTAGQQAMASLEQVVLDAVETALTEEPEDAAASALVADWTSIKHETQYARLFRS